MSVCDSYTSSPTCYGVDTIFKSKEGERKRERRDIKFANGYNFVR